MRIILVLGIFIVTFVLTLSSETESHKIKPPFIRATTAIIAGILLSILSSYCYDFLISLVDRDVPEMLPTASVQSMSVPLTANKYTESSLETPSQTPTPFKIKEIEIGSDARINAINVSMKMRPSIYAQTITTLNRGDQVYISDSTSDASGSMWYECHYNGFHGFVLASVLE